MENNNYPDELVRQLNEELTAAKAKIEELERVQEKQFKRSFELQDEIAAATSEIVQLKGGMNFNYERNQGLVTDLNAANAEIERLKSDRENFVQVDDTGNVRHVFQDAQIKELNEACMKMANERLEEEWPVVKQLHAAEERIAELELVELELEQYKKRVSKIHSAEAREQKLVAALESIDRWTVKNVGQMELCRQDLYDIQDIARAALAEHKGGG